MDPIFHLRELLPSPDDVLRLDADELAGYLLEALSRSGANTISRHNMILSFTNGAPVYVGNQTPALKRHVMEAWAWLEAHALIAADPDSSQYWSFITRRGREVATVPQFAAFREALRFPPELLHPAIRADPWQSFTRGKFDTAVFEAFREVEIAVREACRYPQSDHGLSMIRKAFHKENGPLRDAAADDAERDATSNLFAGALGSYKNPGSHRRVGREDASEAGELLMLASHLLRIVEARAPT